MKTNTEKKYNVFDYVMMIAALLFLAFGSFVIVQEYNFRNNSTKVTAQLTGFEEEANHKGFFFRVYSFTTLTNDKIVVISKNSLEGKVGKIEDEILLSYDNSNPKNIRTYPPSVAIIMGVMFSIFGGLLLFLTFYVP
jgi:hypothetical protein